jgi:hypothetical protein
VPIQALRGLRITKAWGIWPAGRVVALTFPGTTGLQSSREPIAEPAGTESLSPGRSIG